MTEHDKHLDWQADNLDRVLEEEIEPMDLVKAQSDYELTEAEQAKNVEDIILGVQDLHLASKKLDEDNGLG